MPIQAPQWTEYLSCPVCENAFDLKSRPPISLGCGHSVCKTCLANLQRAICPFDQGVIRLPLAQLPVNTALVLLIDPEVEPNEFRIQIEDADVQPFFSTSTFHLEKLALFLRPSSRQQLSRPMQRKLVTLINCQLLEEEGRSRANRAARSLGERSVTELILQHQNPQQLSANLWAAVRARGCQFLGPAMQEEVLKLVLLALEDGSALSRKVLVMFVVQRLEADFPQASKTSIGHVVQLLYRASCFKVSKREGDSSLMQLKEEFRTYETLRREHDAQIVQIATEAGLRIAPDQWSSLLYGDTTHKSHMQSIIDKLQTPQSFTQSVQELVIALQRTGDPGSLGKLRAHLDFLAGLDPSPDSICPDWETLATALNSAYQIVSGLLAFIEQHHTRRVSSNDTMSAVPNSRYKTSMCRDLSIHGSCPRGRNCTFAHSHTEVEQHRKGKTKFFPKTNIASRFTRTDEASEDAELAPSFVPLATLPPVAQVAPFPRGFVDPSTPAAVLSHHPSPAMQQMMSVYTTPMELVEIGPDRGHIMRPPQQGSITSILPVYPNLDVGVHGGARMLAPPPSQLNFAPPGMHVTEGHPTSAMVAPLAQYHLPAGYDCYSSGRPAANLLVAHQFPVAPEHDSNIERFPLRDEGRIKELASPLKVSTGMATKSLSALKSRKEEIIDHLEDLVGREETLRIKSRVCDHPLPIPPAIQAGNPIPNDIVPNPGYYSIWTSKSIATNPDLSSPMTSNVHKPAAVEEIKGEKRPGRTDEDDVIPFTDRPHISRFGPISRKSATPLHAVSPSQTQAVISGEATPTAVVRHSKHMTRQLPTMASLYHQNGSRTTLQPVAVGVNGEIGYIAVPEPTVQSHSPYFTLQQIQHNSSLQQQSASASGTAPSHSLYAESERMKHELAILQKQISDLNLAHIDNHTLARPVHAEEKEELAKELHLIESAIRDREIEIKANHMIIAGDDDSKSQGTSYYDDNHGRSISTTAMSGSVMNKSTGPPN